VRFRPLLSLVLALAATVVHAQAAGTTVLPVVDNGQVEALLLLEPTSLPGMPTDRIIAPAPGRNLMLGNGLQLRAGLTYSANPGVGVFCDSNAKGFTTVGSLAGHCLLADLNGNAPLASGKASGVLQLRRNDKSLTGSLGASRQVLGGALAMPGELSADQRLLDTLLGLGAANVDQRNASLVGQIGIGSQGWIRVGGTLARARLIPASQLPEGLPAEWNTSSFTVGAGSRRLGGEIVGQMIEVPGQPKRFSTLGAGVTWRTPWRARLSVGAENLITRGKNPFGLPDDAPVDEDDEGRVPYVRYQQDL
jgi:hypothetical protein